MKSVISVALCLSLIFFCTACSSESAKQITAATAGYSCDAEIHYGEKFSLNATVKAIGGGLFSIKINTPENISGLEYYFDNGEMTITFRGMGDGTSVPTEYGGLAEILNTVFLKFTTGTPFIPYKNGEYMLSGDNARYSYSITFNEEGFPVKLVVDNENLIATFSNWMY